jgi:Zn-dependent membrane protease YugP
MNYVILILAILLAPLLPILAPLLYFWARARHNKVPTLGGLTGQEVAQAIMDANGLTAVKLGQATPFTGDHFDPTKNEVNLLAGNAQGRTVYAVAVAAHEVGHALQMRDGYRWFTLWLKMAPWVAIASFLFQCFGFFWALRYPFLLFVAIGIYVLHFVFAIITLPVEYDASRRGLAELDRLGLLKTPEERSAARTVLLAAGLTYVAYAVMSLFVVVALVLFAVFTSKSRERA